MEKLLEVKPIAELTGLSIQTIRRYADTGKIRSYRSGINNYRMFKVSEVIEDFKRLNLIA
jgi:excisionase family DNA binding protein